MTVGLSAIVWREPLWLWLALLPWLQWLLAAFRGRGRGRGYADPELMAWALARPGPRRPGRAALFALAWLAFAMALAGPRVAQRAYGGKAAAAAQLMVVLDMSRAMTARDVAPSRLELAKLKLDGLLARAERLRIGLVVYAGTPHLMARPTLDKAVLLHDLRLLRYGLLPTAGSDLARAIGFAARHFAPGDSARALLLVTNGGMAANGAAAGARLEDAVRRAARQGIAVYALGLGTRQGAPLRGANGAWLSYRGKAVVSRLHEERLRTLAALGHGRYATARLSDADWRALYGHGIARLRPALGAGRGGGLIVWHELFGWCLLPGVLFLALAYLEPRRAAPWGASPLLWGAGLVLAAALAPPPAQASSSAWRREAFAAYGRGAYREAQRDYARVAGYAGRMGEGGSAYRLGAYREAARFFAQAVLAADSDAQRARALFNLADSRYRLGDYGAAAELYRQVLRYDPHDRAARSNLRFAIAMLKRARESRGGGGGGQGRGPRSTREPDGTPVTGGSLSLDTRDRAKRPSTHGPTAARPAAGGGSGADFATAAGPRSAAPAGPARRYAPTSPRQIQLKADALDVDQGLLWQRIFARDAGFPAPPAKPRRLPGVLPW